MKDNSFLKTKTSDLDLKKTVRGFLTTANMGLGEKTEIEAYYEKVSHKIQEYQIKKRELSSDLESWDKIEDDPKNTIKVLISKYSTKAELLTDLKNVEEELREWMELGDELDVLRNKYKNFNKTLCFSNIRELLKNNPEVKIGQIEREAGIRLGYMSRLEKEDNTAEPSMEFIVTAAKLLNVTVDTLIMHDVAGLTPTEHYLVSFFDKLKMDTLRDKINWNIESKFELDKGFVDINGNPLHPLFRYETFYRQTEVEYPEEVTESVYLSKTFGPNTIINGDCFNLRLKNGTILYLMDIVKDVHRTNDKNAYVKEAVMYVPGGKTQVLATTHDDYPIGPLLEDLCSIVKDRMKHPQVNNDAMAAIDAFMKDDLEDDPEELPF